MLWFGEQNNFLAIYNIYIEVYKYYTTSDFSKDGAIPADFTSAHKRDSLPVGTFLAPGAHLNVAQFGFIRVQLGGARTAHWAQI